MLKDLKSNSYKVVTALRSCSVRFEKRAREFVLVARLNCSQRETKYENASRNLQLLIINLVNSELFVVTGARPEAR